MGGSRASRPGRRGWPQATTVATELGGVSAKVLAVASVLVVIAVVVVVWLAPSSGGTSASEVIARAAAAHIPGLTCNAPAPDPNVQRYNRDAAEVATAAQCQPGNTWAVTLKPGGDVQSFAASQGSNPVLYGQNWVLVVSGDNDQAEALEHAMGGTLIQGAS